jgi:PadR family transcriptional regulator, regulatory protein PadR
MPNRDDGRTELLQGTLDLMVLRTLEAMGPQHGYAVASRLAQVSDGALQLNMGTLYPALVRLERRGFVRARWDTTENNRRARFYAITAAGRRQLDLEKAGWTRMAGIIERLLTDNG